MSVSENAASGQPCLVLRRQGKLIEAVGRRLARWEEVECEYRWAAGDGTRCCNDLRARERANDDVSTFLRGAANCFGYAGIPSVVDGNRLSLAFRRLVVRGHEAITDGGRRRRLPAGDRQQQCDVRSDIRSAANDCRLLELLVQQLAADDVTGWVIWVARTPGINIGNRCVWTASRCRGNGP